MLSVDVPEYEEVFVGHMTIPTQPVPVIAATDCPSRSATAALTAEVFPFVLYGLEDDPWVVYPSTWLEGQVVTAYVTVVGPEGHIVGQTTTKFTAVTEDGP